MLAGDVGGESLDEGWGWVSVSVCLRESGRGRVAALWEAVAREGEAGGVCVDARGRVLDGLESSRGSSEAPLECRCRFLRKLKPRRPEGRGTGEFVDKTVEATVGAAGAGAVYITAAATMRMYCPGPEASYPSGCVNRVSTTFDRQHSTDALFNTIICAPVWRWVEQRSGAAKAIRTPVVKLPSKRERTTGKPLDQRALDLEPAMRPTASR